MFVLFFIPLLTYSLLHNSGCKPTFCLNPVNVCFSVSLSLFVFPFHVVFVIVQVIVAAVVVVVEEELKLEPKTEAQSVPLLIRCDRLGVRVMNWLESCVTRYYEMKYDEILARWLAVTYLAER